MFSRRCNCHLRLVVRTHAYSCLFFCIRLKKKKFSSGPSFCFLSIFKLRQHFGKFKKKIIFGKETSELNVWALPWERRGVFKTRNGEMTKWRNGEMAKWRNGEIELKTRATAIKYYRSSEISICCRIYFVVNRHKQKKHLCIAVMDLSVISISVFLC